MQSFFRDIIWIYRNEEAVIGENLSFFCLGLGNDGYELGPDVVKLLFKLLNSIKIKIINIINPILIYYYDNHQR